MTDEPPAIGDYALLGDCASAALVSRSGSIEWLCWPCFDSPSLFAAILDRERGGCFELAPAHWQRVERAYVDGTNVLDTRFVTDTGRLRVRDCLVAAPEMEEGVFWPDHHLLREVVCEQGRVELRVRCDPRLDYGRSRPRWEPRGALGWFCQRGTGVLVFRSDIEVAADPAHGLLGRAELREGDQAWLSLSFDAEEAATLPVLGRHAAGRVERTLAFWRGWSARCDYSGPWRDAVVRSALTLKLLTMAASGATVAAPTTSLPEAVGGVRNWDYRFCWLRDSAFMLRALTGLGYEEEARAFFSWLLHTTRQTAPQLNVLYSVFGNPECEEQELAHLEGYRGSRPVRVGNAAAAQLQLDVYGSVVSAAFEFVQRGGSLDAWQARLIARLACWVGEHWDQPDEGIWEIRSDRRRHTYSAAMCWVALDRALRLAATGLLRLPEAKLERARTAIREALESRAIDRASGSYVSALGGEEVDASLLLLAIYGYVAPDAPQMVATWQRIRRDLGAGDLLRRYAGEWDDGLPTGEGAFLVCGFWEVEYLARLGRLDEACGRFERLLRFANDVGLFSEEVEPRSGAALGNFPQAFSHLGLISAALAISEMQGERPLAGLEGSRPAPHARGALRSAGAAAGAIP